MKILVATEKPFAKKALDGITEILQAAGYEVALLEKYTEKEQLIEAVKESCDKDSEMYRSVDTFDNEKRYDLHQLSPWLPFDGDPFR